MKNLKKQYKNNYNTNDLKSRRLSFFRSILFIVILVLFFLLINNTISSGYYYLFVVLIIVFIVLILYHGKIKYQKNKYDIFLNILKEYDGRIDGKWKNFSNIGEHLNITRKDVAKDLDIVGKNSLFQYLNIAKTTGGQQSLLDKLFSFNISKKELKERQESILELKEDLEFCIEFQYELTKEFTKETSLKEKLMVFTPDNKSHRLELFIGAVLSFITITFLVMHVATGLSLGYFLLLSIVNLISALLYNLIYKKELDTVSLISREYGGLYQLYSFLAKKEVQTSKNKRIINDIKEGLSSVKKLNQVYTFDTFRYNSISYTLINGLLPLNIYVLYLFSKVKKEEKRKLEKSIESLEELEALVSLSILGICKEEVCMPEVTSNISLDFTDIKHPLLEEKISIANSFSTHDGIIIITGSNMSGKTSFLRTIGINLMLMNAGGFVTAKTFHAPIVKLFTSMRVSDDIEQGISTFYGELLRIKEVIDYADKEKPVIAFVDEIFKGTNFNDRINGAKKIIKKLSKDNVILFITTHDFELCEINSKKIANYHFEEHYVDENIYFDYKLKKERCMTTNAEYLMKKLDIID